jgi:hypothetical protein
LPARRPLTLPRAERTPLRSFVIAAVGWSALLASLIVFRVTYGTRSENVTAVVALNIPAAPRVAEPPPPGGGGAREPALSMPVPRPALSAEPPALRAFSDRPGLMSPDTLPGVPGGTGRRGLASLGPAWADGIVWRRPTVSEEFGLTNRPIDMDSAVRGRLLAMADSIERNPAGAYRPPSLLFERNGRTYGMDEHGNIHLGGITIPAPLLALIPMPQGNIDQARANARLAAMRADIMRAAARAQAEDDFRRAVKQIRERNDRERAERREREQRDREREIPD